MLYQALGMGDLDIGRYALGWSVPSPERVCSGGR
jgi:hypothetical protein